MNKSILCILVAFISSAMFFMPAVASDYTLQIFGNANMDEDVDKEDIAYLQGIINGTNEPTKLGSHPFMR